MMRRNLLISLILCFTVDIRIAFALSLSEAERLALIHAPRVALANIEKEEKRIASQVVYDRILPLVTSQFSKVVDEHPTQGMPTKIGVQVLQNIPNPWRLHDNLKTRELQLSADQLLVAQVRSETLEMTRIAYFKVVIDEARIRNLDKLKTMIQNNVSVARNRYENGLLSKSEFDRIKLDLHLIEARERIQRQALDTHRKQLSLILNLSPDRLADLSSPLPSWDLAPQQFSELNVFFKNHHSNPNVRIKEILQEVAVDEHSDVLYDYLPSLQIGYQYSSLKPHKDHQHAAILSMEWTLDQESILARKKKLSEQAQRKAVELFRLSKVQFEDQLLEALSQIQSDLQELTLLQTREEVYQSIVKENKRRYDQGLINTQDLSSDWRELLESIDNSAEKHLSLIQGWATLATLVGKPTIFLNPLKRHSAPVDSD